MDSRKSLYFCEIVKHFIRIILGLALFANASLHAQKFDGLALTPPMGWNSWNKFQCDVNETIVRGDGRSDGDQWHEGRRLSIHQH